jgi:plastocyanin
VARRLISAVVVLLFVATACNSRILRPPATIYVDGGEQNLTPATDTTQRSFPAVLLGFYPSKLELYPGDSVRFEMRFNGEPHAVALGTDIDKALAAVDKHGSLSDPARNEEVIPKTAFVPNVFPSDVQKTPAVQRSAAEPCFLDAGDDLSGITGEFAPCPKRKQPAFDGTQRFYSSGFLPEGEGFRVKLSDDIKPGTYRFMCLVHRAGMQGSIVVKKPGTGRPNVRDVKLQGRDQQRVDTAAATTVVTDAVKAVGTAPITAGAGPEGEVPAFVASFIPDVKSVKVNEPVTWKFFETHSISFKTTRAARKGLLIKERDGTVKLNLDAWNAVGSKALPDTVQTYWPSGTKKADIDGGTYSGDGEWSSGIIRAIPPRAVTYTMRFSKPGTYTYSCLVHHGMRGKIVVT